MSDTDSESTLPLPATSTSSRKGTAPAKPGSSPPSIAHNIVNTFFEYCGAILVLCGGFVAIAAAAIVLPPIYLVTGHAILRSAHNEYSASLASSAQVGAVGAAVFGVPLLLFWLFIGWVFGEEINFRVTQSTKIALAAPKGAIVGAVGASVLQHYGHATLDVVHATRAGALGGPLIMTGWLLLFGWS